MRKYTFELSQTPPAQSFRLGLALRQDSQPPGSSFPFIAFLQPGRTPGSLQIIHAPTF